MVDQIIRARFDFSNTPGATPNRAIPQGGAAIQQADGKLLTIRPNGTTRVTDIRDIVEQLATGPLAAAFALKADLVNGRVPIEQLPPGFGGGGPATITASQISDASASGRSVLTGTPAAGRSALGLGTAAVLAVGVSGGVPAFDDARIAASQALGAATVVSTAAEPPWANGKGQFDRLRVSVGRTDRSFWAGGDRDKPADQQTLGHYSAITGTLNVPVESNLAVDAAGVPVTIISAAVSGLVQTESNQNVAVGLFANARVNTPNGRVWGLNVVTSNYSSSFTKPAYGNAAQINGIEIDCGWLGTQAPVTGSNLIGIWIPAEFDRGRPDGAADAIRIGRYGRVEDSFPWKNFLSSDHGGAERFAQLGMVKHPNAEGGSGGQGLYWITSSGGVNITDPNDPRLARPGYTLGDTNRYHHTFMNISPAGEVVFQPDYYGASAGLVVGNSTLSQSCVLHPINGVSGPKGTFDALQINQNAEIRGNLDAKQNASVSGNLTVGGSATVANINAGNVVATGTVYAPGLIYRNSVVQLVAGNAIPANAKLLAVFD